MGEYHGDVKKGAIIYFTWDTNDAGGASVNPTVAGTISVYKDDNVVQSVAGITDVRTFDALVGIHNVKIDTSDVFYTPGHDYSVVLSAATIDGQVVNSTLRTFSIENRNPNLIAQDTAQSGGPTTIRLAATASAVNDYYVGATVYITTGTGSGQARIITAYDGATTTATVYPAWKTQPDNTSVYKLIPLGSAKVDAINSAVQTALVNAIIDEVLTSATHDVPYSLGRRLRDLTITSGTAQAGAANSIQLAVGESAQDHIHNQDIIYISKGLGAGQKRVIMDYAGGTKTAVVDRAWDINPNNTSEYVIIPRADELVTNQGIAQAGSPTTKRLAATASAVNDYYTGSLVYIASGAGAGQSPRIITGYTGANTTATVYPAWATNPDNTSVYKVIPLGSSMIDAVDPALQALVVTTLVNAFHDADLALHLGAAIDNRTIGGMLAQLRLSKYADVQIVRAVAAVPAQGITLPMAASGVIQYEIVRISLTRNFLVPDFTYYDLWRYDVNQYVVEVKASLNTIW